MNRQYRFFFIQNKATSTLRFLHIFNTGYSKRTFTCRSSLSFPIDNDHDRLLKQFESLEEDFNDTDDKIENLSKKIKENEKEIQEDEDDTELSKFLDRREQEKDNRVGKFEQFKDHALFSNKDKREDVSLMLELIKKSARKDISTFKTVKEHLDSEDECQDEASDIIAELEKQQKKASDLLGDWHENDLNFIRPSYTENSNQSSNAQEPQGYSDPNQSNQSSNTRIPQDSSQVSQSDFSPFDHIGDD